MCGGDNEMGREEECEQHSIPDARVKHPDARVKHPGADPLLSLTNPRPTERCTRFVSCLESFPLPNINLVPCEESKTIVIYNVDMKEPLSAWSVGERGLANIYYSLL
jgi:hypothetical protein